LLGWIVLRPSEVRTTEKYKPFGGVPNPSTPAEEVADQVAGQGVGEVAQN
jgi:hypothetical protein